MKTTNIELSDDETLLLNMITTATSKINIVARISGYFEKNADSCNLFKFTKISPKLTMGIFPIVSTVKL